MADKEHYKPQQIIDALKITKGMIYLAADRLGCNAITIRNYAKRYAAVRDALEAENERVNDISELKLIQAIQAGEPWAIKYRLSTKARSRGYTEHVEVAHDLTERAADTAAALIAAMRQGASGDTDN